MSGDELLGGDAEQEMDVERARISQELIAEARGLPPSTIPDAPGHLTEDDKHLAQALANSAVLALMHWSADPAHVDDVITRVQGVIASKATLEIAKGMVAQYAGTTVGEAARLLSAYASERQVRLTETAHALVTRGMTPGAVVDAQSLA